MAAFNPWLILGAFLALVGAYFYGRHDGGEIAEAQRLRDEQVVRQVFDQAQAAAAGEIAKIRVRNTTTLQTLEKEIHEKPVYRDCRHTPDGLRSINAAITGAEPADSGKLPAADPAR